MNSFFHHIPLFNWDNYLSELKWCSSQRSTSFCSFTLLHVSMMAMASAFNYQCNLYKELLSSGTCLPAQFSMFVPRDYLLV